MKNIFLLLLSLIGFAYTNAKPISCFKFTEKTGMDMSDAVCILSNDSIIPLSSDGRICLDVYIGISNKFRIRKPSYCDYIIYIINWEDSSEYKVWLSPKIEKPLPEVFETKKSKPYILGNTQKTKKGLIGELSLGSELCLYFDSEVDTGFAFLNNFYFYVAEPFPTIPYRYRINIYELNKATVSFDKYDNLIRFEPDYESIIYSSKLYDIDKIGWHKVEIDKLIPSSDFIVGIETVLSNKNTDTTISDKILVSLNIGMSEKTKDKKNKVPYQHFGSHINLGSFKRIYIFNPYTHKNFVCKGNLAVYCELKNYY